MITSFLKSIFGGNEAEQVTESNTTAQKCAPEDSPFQAEAIPSTEPDDLVKFVDYIVRGLVDHPEEVNIECDATDPAARHMRIFCAKDDVGKVVGKRGKTIIAIRSLANGAAGRIQQRITLEVQD